MKVSLQILLLLLFVQIGKASVQTDSFLVANEAYKNNDFDKAVKIYDQLIDKGIIDAKLFYNLGNVHYKKGAIAEAILNYEKALKIAPNDKDIKHNLELANIRVLDKIETTPEFFILTWWKKAANFLPSNQWFVISLIAIWSCVLAFIFYLFSQKVLFQKAAFFKAFFFFLVALLTLLLSITQNNLKNKKDAIVFMNSVSVKSEPSTGATDLFILHEGVKVTIIDQDNKWEKIKIGNDKIGWLPKSSMREI